MTHNMVQHLLQAGGVIKQVEGGEQIAGNIFVAVIGIAFILPFWAALVL